MLILYSYFSELNVYWMLNKNTLFSSEGTHVLENSTIILFVLKFLLLVLTHLEVQTRVLSEFP